MGRHGADVSECCTYVIIGVTVSHLMSSGSAIPFSRNRLAVSVSMESERSAPITREYLISFSFSEADVEDDAEATRVRAM